MCVTQINHARNTYIYTIIVSKLISEYKLFLSLIINKFLILIHSEIHVFTYIYI